MLGLFLQHKLTNHYLDVHSLFDVSLAQLGLESILASVKSKHLKKQTNSHK